MYTRDDKKTNSWYINAQNKWYPSNEGRIPFSEPLGSSFLDIKETAGSVLINQTDYKSLWFIPHDDKY